MWIAVVLSSALCICVSSLGVINDCVFPEKVGDQADYYWREYRGVIPRDAVPGGYAYDGNTTYIAQLPSTTFHGVVVGNVYRGRQEAMACPAERFINGQYVKILCSNSHNKFEWISTTADSSHLLTDYHWVVGGVELPTALTTYTGRATFEGRFRLAESSRVSRYTKACGYATRPESK